MRMNFYDPRDARFTRVGRYDPAETACALWWSGAGVRMNYAGTALEVEVEAAEGVHMPWLGVLVDGAIVARVPTLPGARRYALLSGMDASVTHEVTLLRDTQPTVEDSAPLTLRSVYADGEITPAAPRPRLIEFLGDSLTVGEGLAGRKDAMEWRMAWICHMRAFPTLLAERLRAEKRVIALGGWGTWRSWDGDANCRIGRIYDQVCAAVPGGEAPRDPQERPADAVVINLGTNDASWVGKLPEAERDAAREEVTDCAAALMAAARRQNPGARILWAYGMCGTQLEAPLRRAVDIRRAAGDDRVEYVSLERCLREGDIGSREHPGALSHRIAAEILCEALEK